MSQERIEKLKRAIASPTTPSTIREQMEAELAHLTAPPPPPKPKPRPKPKPAPPPPPREFTDEEKAARAEEYRRRRAKRKS